MSIQAVAAALRAPTKTTAQRLVLIALANYADDADMCWPKQVTLALDTGMHPSSVRRTLKQLQELGLIRRDHRYRPGGMIRTSDTYQLAIPNRGRGMKVAEGADKNHQSKNRHRGLAYQGTVQDKAGGSPILTKAKLGDFDA